MSKFKNDIIIPQQQVDDKTCMQACAAMIAGVDVGFVVERARALFDDNGVDDNAVLGCEVPSVAARYHDPPSTYTPQALSNLQLDKLLVFYGYLPLQQQYPTLYDGHVYIAHVPSLNFAGRLHAVVIDTRGEDVVVCDPQRGRKDREYYNAEKLTSWCRATRILEV